MASRSSAKLTPNKSKVSLSASSTSTDKSEHKGRKNKRVTLGDGPEDKEGQLAFQVLNQAQTQEVLGLDVDEIQTKVCEIFQLSDFENDLKTASLVDYYTGAIWWGKEQKFNEQQLSGFFTLAYNLLENVKEKQMSKVDNFMEMKKALVGIGGIESVDVPSGGLEFFDVQQGKDITKYMFTSLFQHYRLYEFMFTHSQAEEIIGTDLEIEIALPADAPFPPPLDEGVPEETFQVYIVTPPPSPTPEPEEVKEGEVDEALQELESDMSKDIFSELTVDDIREVIESATKDVFDGLQTEVASKLKDKENQIIGRLNKIHKTAE